MNPLNLDGMSQFLGPGLGGLWAGEQQGLAVDAEKLRQQKTLEDLMTTAQNRDIAKQKLPFELDEMRARTGLNEASAGESRQRTAAGQVKLDREKFTNAMDILSQTTLNESDPMENAFRVDEIIKQNGLDPNDPRMAMLRRATQDPNAWKKLMDGWVFGQAEQRRKMQEKQVDLDREQMQQTGANQRQASQNATQLEIANIRRDQALRVAQAKTEAGKDAEGKKNYAQAYTAYISAADAAEQAGDVEQARQLRQRADLMLQADAAVRGAAANTPKPGAPVLPEGSGIQQRPAQPLPTAPPMSAQGPASSVPAPRQMTPQDQQAMAWARANPQDPRAKAILQKLGVQ